MGFRRASVHVVCGITAVAFVAGVVLAVTGRVRPESDVAALLTAAAIGSLPAAWTVLAFARPPSRPRNAWMWCGVVTCSFSLPVAVLCVIAAAEEFGSPSEIARLAARDGSSWLVARAGSARSGTVPVVTVEWRRPFGPGLVRRRVLDRRVGVRLVRLEAIDAATAVAIYDDGGRSRLPRAP